MMAERVRLCKFAKTKRPRYPCTKRSGNISDGLWKVHRTSHMTTALRVACTHQTIGDSHGTRRERISSLRKTPSTWKTSIRAGTMTMYYVVNTGGDCQNGK